MRLATLFASALVNVLAATAASGQTTISISPPVVTTSGQGEVKVTPDRASVMIGVQTRGATATAVGADNASRTRAVLDAMTKIGLPKEALSTEGYSVYPEMRYDRDGGAPRVTGYVATNTVRVEARRLDQVGAIIDASLAAGANGINGLSFYMASLDEARRQAISAAVSNARADAEAMATAAGGTLGQLLEVSTGGPIVPPRPTFDLAVRSPAGGAGPQPAQTGAATARARVSPQMRG